MPIVLTRMIIIVTIGVIGITTTTTIGLNPRTAEESGRVRVNPGLMHMNVSPARRKRRKGRKHNMCVKSAPNHCAPFPLDYTIVQT